MSERLDTLEITIQHRRGDVWPVVAEWRRSGLVGAVRSEDVLRLSKAQQNELLTLLFEPLAYGTMLGEALFLGGKGKIQRAFDRAQAGSAGRLRVLFHIEGPELKPLHWERLCAPLGDDEWDFLALDQRVPFSLYLPSSTDRRFPAIGQRDLRTLLLVASPQGLDKYKLDGFKVEPTVASVQRALGEIDCDALAMVAGAVGPPTLDALCDCLTGGHYTLLHIVAHSQVKAGETTLYLADKKNQVAPVPGQTLITRLRRLGPQDLPHLAFLATCESAKPEAEAGLGGLAQRLVKKLGLPAVLAMTETVSIATAEALGKKFYKRLREHGQPDRALVEACAGLAGHHDITVPVLYSRLEGRPLFSDTEDRELTDKEIGFGLDELERLLPARAPVLQEDFAAQAQVLRGMLDRDRTKLSKALREEWGEAEAEINSMCEEVLDLNFRGLALRVEPPAYDDRCPFPGLLAFGSRFATSGKSGDDDREFFFGREKLVSELVGKLQAHPFLAVLGSSGSGKSSLVLAGLVPALKKTYADLRMAYMTPGNDPHARLDAALAEVASGGQPVPPDARPPSGVNPLSSILVVDQFEELFRLTQDGQARQAFVQRLLALTEQHLVVLTMRADFWGDCAPYPTLRYAMLAHQVLIAPMTSAELRSAMEQQAAAVGLRFEADLSNTILDAVEGEPGAMPLLQHLLREMWKRRHGRWLRASEYRALGGIQQAIAHTADGMYAALSPTEQATVRNIFVRLTRLDEETIPAQEQRDTRKRIALEGLVPVGGDRELVRQLVHWLAGSDTRLVVTSLNPVTGQEEVEVAHEALIRYWPNLHDWLDQDRLALRQLQVIGRAAEDWEQGDRSPTLLIHRGERLTTAMGLVGHSPYPPNDLEATYLEACLALDANPRIADVEIHIRGCEKAGYPVEITVDGEGLARGHLAPAILPWTSSASARAGGSRLFRSLFATGDLYDAWVSTRYRRPNRRIRLRIEDAASALDTIPWELLHDPGRALPAQDLGSVAVTPFCRYVRGRWLPGVPVIRRPIRVLAAIDSPGDWRTEDAVEPIDRAAEFAALQSAVEGLEIAVTRFPPDGTANGNLKSSQDASVQSNTRGESERCDLPVSYLAELQRGYHVFHVVSHGVVREGKAALWLADEENRPVPVSAQELATALTGLLTDPDTPLPDRLRLVFLSVPQNAEWASATVNPFCGVARELVTAGVPAVLIIPRPMRPEAFQQFVGTFYDQLLVHGQVDLAANQARAALLARGADPTQLPILFTRLRDGLLLGRRGPVGGKQDLGGPYLASEEEPPLWARLLRSINRGTCTPILGPGVNDGLLPPAETIADELAAKYNLPGSLGSDLPLVLRFIDLYGEPERMRRAYLDIVQLGLFRCLGVKPATNQHRLTGVGLAEAAATLGWAERVRSIHEAEIHHLLADLPLPLYVTTNVDNFMALALEAKLRHPVRRHVINWREGASGDIPWLERPSPEDPVVLHLFGVDDQPDSMVLTANDQLDWMARISAQLDSLFPASILATLAMADLLFLGYQQGDPVMDVVQRGLLSRFDRRRWERMQVLQLEAEESESRRQETADYLRTYFDASNYAQHVQSGEHMYWGTAQQFALELWTNWEEHKRG